MRRIPLHLKWLRCYLRGEADFSPRSSAVKSHASREKALAADRGERLGEYLIGAGSVVDPLPTYAAPRSAVQLSDRQAMRSDLQAVGNDMQQALGLMNDWLRLT
jgi:hypothetical protein